MGYDHHRPHTLPVVCLFAALVSGGCSAGNLSFLPADAAAALAKPTHVEAYRVGKLDDHPGYGGKVDGFAAVRTGHVDAATAGRVSEAATDPEGYRDATRPCEFVPSIAYRFYRRLDAGRGQDSVDVLVSFDCDEVMFVSRDPRQHEVFRRLIAADPGRGRWISLARDTFPLDLDLQSLPERRPPITEPSNPP